MQQADCSLALLAVQERALYLRRGPASKAPAKARVAAPWR